MYFERFEGSGKGSGRPLFDASGTHVAGISQVDCLSLAKLPVRHFPFHIQWRGHVGALSVSHFIKMSYHVVQRATHAPDEEKKMKEGGVQLL